MPQAHTPGPWSVEDIGANCFLISGQVEQTDTGGELRSYYNRIGSVTQRDPHPTHGGGIDRNTALANAKLIAAAPLMKEACDFILANAFERKWPGDERAYSLLSAIAAATK